MLRERGEKAEAARIEAEQLPDVLASLHAAGESDDAIQQRLTSLFAIEEERVADAAVLAELLLPALRGQVVSSVSASTAVGAQTQAAELPVMASRPPVLPTPPASSVPRKRSTDIATFIDEMLAQESTPARRAS